MDERKFIKFRIQFESQYRDTVVLGSSRVMQIGEHNYKGKIINLGVSGASIEDDVAIAGMAIKNFQPSSILIGADPWLFNSKSGQERWKSLYKEYIAALSSLKISTAHLADLTDDKKQSRLFTISSKIYDLVNYQNFNAINDIPETRSKIRRDGSRVYNLAYAKNNQKEISAGFNDLLNYSMTDYDESKKSQDIFGRFIDAYSKNYNVVLVLSPYHPDLYEHMKIKRPIYLEIESNFRHFSKLHGVKIIGSYNPYKVGCTSTDFYDGIHPNDVCMGKVLNELEFSKNDLVTLRPLMPR